MKYLFLLGCLFLCCLAPQQATPGTSLVVGNMTPNTVVVYAAFGADSVITPKDWPFCATTSSLTCSFLLGAHEDKVMPSSKYLNVTLSFDSPVGCGSTKAELNLSNPSWFDTADISLVDGFNRALRIVADGNTLGPVLGQANNESLFGVFPYGCDTCVARNKPPCGIVPGKEGCKAGTQFDPTPPCQWQGTRRGGGGLVRVELL